MGEWEGSLEYESKGAQGELEVSLKAEKSWFVKNGHVEKGLHMTYMTDKQVFFIIKKKKLFFESRSGLHLVSITKEEELYLMVN